MFKAKNVENASEVIAERHQAPFTANLVEASNQKVPIARAAFDCPKRMLDDGGSASHQFVCALHPCTMSFENIFMLPAANGPYKSLRR